MSEEKRRGRPPKPRLTQGNFTFRTPADLREKLQRVAAENNRSVSEEITTRLERSFDREALLDDVRQMLNELPVVGLSGTEERVLQ